MEELYAGTKAQSPSRFTRSIRRGGWRCFGSRKWSLAELRAALERPAHRAAAVDLDRRRQRCPADADALAPVLRRSRWSA